MIPTFLDASKIQGAGTGLFAAHPVKKGDVIWRFDDRIDKILTVRTVESLPTTAQQFIYKFGCQCRDDLWLLCGDDARFVNHSTPGVMKCALGDHFDSEDLALHDFGAGEEITEDYNNFALDFQRRGFYRPVSATLETA